MECDDELRGLAEGLARLLLSGMSARSRWAVRAALDAASKDGVSGTLKLGIPAKVKRDETDLRDRSRHFCIAGFATQWGDD